MLKKKLTLKSSSRIPQQALPASGITSATVIEGRYSKRIERQSCPEVIERLNGLVKNRDKVFIQMRHGVGYCGTPVLLENGWLTMINVSIGGTKQTATSSSILIKIRDGGFISHLHPVDMRHKVGERND